MVVSFAFGISSDVAVRYLGDDLARAKTIFDEIVLNAQSGDGYKDLADLLEIDEGFEGNYTCFWGILRKDGVPKGVKVIQTNND